MTCFLKILMPILIVLCAAPETTEGRKFIIGCYFVTWAADRTNVYSKVTIPDIPTKLCTHVFYLYAYIDTDKKVLRVRNPTVEIIGKRYTKFTGIKKTAPGIKVLLMVYGGNDKFLAITESPFTINKFADSVIEFLREYDFEGIDVDWGYLNADSKNKFITLLKVLRQKIDEEVSSNKLLLTVKAPANISTIDQAYDIPEIAKLVDFVSILTNHYHSVAGGVAGFNCPLYSREPELNKALSMNDTVHYYLEKGLPASKAVLLVPCSGKRFVLADKNNHDVGAKTTDELRSGDIFGFETFLAYPEICLMLKKPGTKKAFDKRQRNPYCFNGDDWVGYEDPESLKIKVEWMQKLKLGGISMWRLDQDDSSGKACDQGRYPLLTAVNRALGTTVSGSGESEGDGNGDGKTKNRSSAVEAHALCTLLMSAFAFLLVPFQN